MKVFKHLQIISIKNPIFNIPLNIFLSNNWKKSNACRFLNSYVLKWYESRRMKKSFRGSNFVQKFGPSYKKGRLSKLFFLYFRHFPDFFCPFLIFFYFRRHSTLVTWLCSVLALDYCVAHSDILELHFLCIKSILMSKLIRLFFFCVLFFILYFDVGALVGKALKLIVTGAAYIRTTHIRPCIHSFYWEKKL